MIFFQIPFHTNTLTFLLLQLCNRLLKFFTGSLLGAWLWPNSIIISVINNFAWPNHSSTSFILSITTLSLCTVNSTHMVAQKGQHIKIYLYTSRPTYLHQDLFIYTKIYLYKSRFTSRHQDIFIYIKISL